MKWWPCPRTLRGCEQNRAQSLPFGAGGGPAENQPWPDSSHRSEVRCLHEGVDANNLENTFVLRSGYKVSSLGSSHFGFDHSPCLLALLIFGVGREFVPRAVQDTRFLAPRSIGDRISASLHFTAVPHDTGVARTLLGRTDGA
jgi:hypothetical protein